MADSTTEFVNPQEARLRAERGMALWWWSNRKNFQQVADAYDVSYSTARETCLKHQEWAMDSEGTSVREAFHRELEMVADASGDVCFRWAGGGLWPGQALTVVLISTQSQEDEARPNMKDGPAG